MRLSLPALVLLPLALAACGKQQVKPPADYALSGQIAGNWGASPQLRLALVGTGVPIAVTNNSAVAQNVVSSGANAWNFGFDLPGIPSIAGVYQVVAFDDANNDAKFNLGETVARNRLWLIFSPAGGTFGPLKLPDTWPGGSAELLPAMTVSRGWNVYDQSQALGGGNPRAFTTLADYNISR
ncbi:hypothetical protein [Deinococcus arenicola]|uniref:Lipoprotein n=1 Tax=Deinococcus arenicola TaxID=2994950 RepID=A0ABU4DNT0_9DEIO|nr:hypothetical protein [Deinococcus sp. ZS9-10]MDV6374094.1 hypothetical protein [Deinococcus sp. ZS9-10]